ncbi:MAG: di-heme-cytochrome C peroxidase [Cellvibrionaceae bacterium]
MAALNRLVTRILIFFFQNTRALVLLFLLLLVLMFIALAIGKTYQHWDNDPERGAIGISDGSFDESYETPVYVEQGWGNSDSLWFYNTTQGSNLMPYDLFVELEQADSEELFRSASNMDYFRYLPQKPTFFNPDGLPIGFAKDGYDGKEYIGYTCAACHTGQVNYQGKGIRIDGGAAMADMDGFLSGLETALTATLNDTEKKKRLVENVLARNDFWRIFKGGRDYKTEQDVLSDLKEWANRIQVYNTLNESSVDYGYARLDAFGRIYNRVLEHVLDKGQIANKMAFVFYEDGTRVINDAQIENVLDGLDSLILGQKGFEEILKRLQKNQSGYPALDEKGIALVRQELFNEANAPVSYPFLWDIAQSDYVQWNGLAANAGVGPLGRNTGEVIGVFATLDWREDKQEWWEFWEMGRRFSLSALISGQSKKRKHIDFQSSIDKVNLNRLESHLKSLKSPQWSDVKFADGSGLPPINPDLAERGEAVYAKYCLSCHEIIDRNDWDRRIIGKMMSVEKAGTDPVMAMNSVTYKGSSGNFKHIYQDTDAGPVIVEETAPVVQILTAATRGVIATPDHDKWVIRRWLDWLYTLGSSFFQNDIKPSIKNGDYEPDSTANPYASLQAYKARPLNGIWATAPYLHNGSVPTLYDLLLPKKRPGDPDDGEYRPNNFQVGCRELDVIKMGLLCSGTNGTAFDTEEKGNSNAGHEYAAGFTAPLGKNKPLPRINKQDRMALIEFIKTL